MDRIAKLRSRLLLKQPFFGTILMTTPLIASDSVPTAATDMRTIWYNPGFFTGLPDAEVVGVLSHEVMHIVLKHGLRRGNRDPRLWNMAADYAINWMLTQIDGLALPAGALIDPMYDQWSAEKIYDALLKDQPTGQDQGQAGQDQDQGQGQGGQDQAEQSDRGSAPGAKPADSGAPDGHLPGHESAGGMGRDILPTGHMSPDEQAKLGRDITAQVAQAANMARMAGKLPGALERTISEALNPAVPIEDILREYMTAHDRDDESWERRNRRFRDIYLPDRYNDAMGEVVMIGDTSGSVTDDELRMIAGMVTRIVENMNPERVRMIWADAAVAGEQVFEPGDPLDFQPKGGGGTDMRVPLDYIARFSPVVAVMVTDGETPWPARAPEYPLIVCCTTAARVPVGEVIRI